MIDPRFQLVTTEHKHLYHLRFSVVLPPVTYSTIQIVSIIAEAEKQYPELVFDYQGIYSARFPDGQYARCIKERKNPQHTECIEELVFSLPLQLDTIMAGVCSFKKAVPPLEFSVDPASLVDLTPDEFYEEVGNMYALRYSLSLRVRAVDWSYFALVDGEPVYLLTPTDYDYI